MRDLIPLCPLRPVASIKSSSRFTLAGLLLLTLLPITGCATFPQSTQFSLAFGHSYSVRGSSAGIVEYLQRLLRRKGISTREERRYDGSDTVVLITEHLPAGRIARRDRRVSYHVEIRPAGGLLLAVKVHCLVETKGIYEREWTSDPADNECDTPSGGELYSILEALEQEARRRL